MILFIAFILFGALKNITKACFLESVNMIVNHVAHM